jgi:hypothetical protein
MRAIPATKNISHRGTEPQRGKKICMRSQVPGSTFKVWKKNRIDDPKIWQSMLCLTNNLQWPPVFEVGTVGTGGSREGAPVSSQPVGENATLNPEPLNP